MSKTKRTARSKNEFAGRWLTTFGPMELSQDGSHIRGTYVYDGVVCTLEGELEDDVFHFEYNEPVVRGEGHIQLRRHGRFAGWWRPEGSLDWGQWTGERLFEGIWECTFDGQQYFPLRLFQERGRVHGIYECVGSSSLDGSQDGNRLDFRYVEPSDVSGQGWFELAEDLQTFRGEWTPGTQPDRTIPWLGRRKSAQASKVWLIVLEAHWQNSLDNRDYAFGAMLKEFFARIPNIEVRHRFFSDTDELVTWCRQLLFVPEPIALVFAAHGDERGLIAHGEPVDPEPVTDILQSAASVFMLHFSACLVMDDGEAGEFSRKMHQRVHFPMSGYASSVDWGASALIEFTFLDMVLTQHVSVEEAARRITDLIAFAGEAAIPSSPYPPARFRYLSPKGSGPS